MELQWKAPEPSAWAPRRTTKWKSIADALRDRPGQWALVAESVSRALASGIKKRVLLPGEFEITTRKNGEDGKCDMYARYIGGETR